MENIISESNRKHGGMGNIEILAESIKTEGLISPPTVAANEDGTYRIIAGRRRIAAVRLLDWEEVTVRVIDGAESDHLESIALSENVNRQEMHPLDEAELFKKLLDKGTDIKDIAAYYDRSIPGIYHRIKLCDLADGVKEMFREGKINLSGAALIASLSPKDQEKFHKKFGGVSVNRWDIAAFIHSAQQFTLRGIGGNRCEECRDLTHNTTPGLFDEYDSLEDVCLDAGCYEKLWKNTILDLIVKNGNFENTERKIILDRNIPQFVPKKTASINLGGEDYFLLSSNEYQHQVSSKKSKKDTAWFVCLDREKKATVLRVVYKKNTPDTPVKKNPDDPVKGYMIDQLPEIKKEDREAAFSKVKEKYGSRWELHRQVTKIVFRKIVEKRLNEESRVNLAAEYLMENFGGIGKDGKRQEIDPEYLWIFRNTLGTEGIGRPSDIPVDPQIQQLFAFIIASESKVYMQELPDLNDSEDEWKETEKILFWKFAQLDRDEYRDLYKKALAALVRNAGVGKGGKKMINLWVSGEDWKAFERTDHQITRIEK